MKKDIDQPEGYSVTAEEPDDVAQPNQAIIGMQTETYWEVEAMRECLELGITLYELANRYLLVGDVARARYLYDLGAKDGDTLAQFKSGLLNMENPDEDYEGNLDLMIESCLTKMTSTKMITLANIFHHRLEALFAEMNDQRFERFVRENGRTVFKLGVLMEDYLAERSRKKRRKILQRLAIVTIQTVDTAYRLRY